MWTFFVPRLPQRLGASRRPMTGSGLPPKVPGFPPSRECGIVGIGSAKTSYRQTPLRDPLRISQSRNQKEVLMLYALLAYHVEADVAAWTPEEDAAVMTDLHRVRDRLNQKGHLGPAARLGWTKKARTLRGPGAGLVIDGPFAETKEQLLGFYILDCATEEAAIEAARDLRRVNPSAVYEIRPLALYLPGVAFPRTEATADDQAGRV
jgi:hypothetical protein